MSASCTQNFVIKLDTCVRKKKIGPITIRDFACVKLKVRPTDSSKNVFSRKLKRLLLFLRTIQFLIFTENLSQTLLKFLNYRNFQINLAQFEKTESIGNSFIPLGIL